MALLCAAASALTPRSRVKGVVRLACTLAMTVTLLLPLCRLDMDSYAAALARTRETMRGAGQNGAESADRLRRTIIEQECAAYISDKGLELGLGEIAVRVLAKWGDAFWYPHEVWLETEPSEALTKWIEGELGVPRERMHWNHETNEAG
jgi:hypothetical protein